MLSRRWGLGMKAMSPPSFTSRPIHQSLLYFWGWGGIGRGSERRQPWLQPQLSNVKEPGWYSQSWSEEGSTQGEGAEGTRGKGSPRFQHEESQLSQGTYGAANLTSHFTHMVTGPNQVSEGWTPWGFDLGYEGCKRVLRIRDEEFGDLFID